MIQSAPHHAHSQAHRLVRWQRIALYSTGTLLLATGSVWLAAHYTVGAGAGALPHPVEVWILRLHGLAAFAGLFMLGVLMAAHIPQGWRLSYRRIGVGQRNSGVLLCALGSVLTVSGYLLFYFASEAVRPALGWFHAFAGAAMAALVVQHRRGSRRQPAARHSQGGPSGGMLDLQSECETISFACASALPRPSTSPTTMLLNELSDGAHAKVARVLAASAVVDAGALRRLAELGFIAGEPVQMLRRGPGGREPLAVLIGDTMFGLRLLEAQCIEVQPD